MGALYGPTYSIAVGIFRLQNFHFFEEVRIVECGHVIFEHGLVSGFVLNEAAFQPFNGLNLEEVPENVAINSALDHFFHQSIVVFSLLFELLVILPEFLEILIIAEISRLLDYVRVAPA